MLPHVDIRCLNSHKKRQLSIEPLSIDIDISLKIERVQVIRDDPDAQRAVTSKTECQISESCFREANILRIESSLVTHRRRFTQVNTKSAKQPAENPPSVFKIQALNIKAVVVNHLLLLSM